jgi:hypothetical protein
MIKTKLTIILLSVCCILNINAQSNRVPGVVVDYIPASSKTYIGSPSICILPDGDYVASHDYFGPGSTEYQQALTAIFKSTDRGKSWKKISEINGQFWSNLFVHKNVLYIMGTFKHHGNFIIRRSFDGGISWSEPAGSVRNTLVLKSSSDLKTWAVHKVLLKHPDVKKHGFQYVDWQFDGRDIIFLSRTAYDDESGGASNYHDANYLTFHRIRNYASFGRKTEDGRRK